MPDTNDILLWLGNDSRGVPLYLNPLNLVWSPEGAEHDLLSFQRVAARLQTEPALWSAAIRDPGWRPTLAACTCLLVARERGFLRDLCDAFRGGSWVLPQVAVTLGILHPDEARSFFGAFLASEGGRSPKHNVSARRVLECLGALSEAVVSPSGWSGSDADDAAVADAVVREHWEFWSSRSTRTA